MKEVWEYSDTIHMMWAKSFEEAKQESIKTNKPIFLYFHSPD
jgi:hypothetical protein